MDAPGPADVVRWVTMHDHRAASGPIERDDMPADGLSAQQRFELERSSGHPLQPLSRALLRLGGLVAPHREAAINGSGRSVAAPLPRHLEGLPAAGGVLLGARLTPVGRRRIDHLLIAPAGVYAVEERPWRGQVQVAGGDLFVDGRQRAGVADGVAATAAAVEQALAEELGALGLRVTPVIWLAAAETSLQVWRVGEVVVTCGRGLLRHVRSAPPLLGSDTVVRVALVADRLLERTPSA